MYGTYEMISSDLSGMTCAGRGADGVSPPKVVELAVAALILRPSPPRSGCAPAAVDSRRMRTERRSNVGDIGRAPECLSGNIYI